MTEEASARDIEEYWAEVRNSKPNVESSVEALYRALEALNQRISLFCSIGLTEERASRVVIKRHPKEGTWILILTCYKPNEKGYCELKVEHKSHTEAMKMLFDAVVNDFQADIDERTREADETEKDLISQRDEIKTTKQLHDSLGTFIPEQTSLFEGSSLVE